MTVNEWIQITRKVEYVDKGTGRTYEAVRPRVICADGYNVSIQANRYCYCDPRIDGAAYYHEVELGYPSMEDSLINCFAEDHDDYTDTVYGYVPVEIVDQLLEKHGGISIIPADAANAIKTQSIIEEKLIQGVI